jgi:sugar phosphate isomerase/epimerase
MNLYVRRSSGGVIAPRGGGGARAAGVEGDPLAESDPAGWAASAVKAAAAVPGRRVVAWSGTLAEDGPFGRDPRTWMRPGREALRAFCAAVRGPLLDAAARVALRPHARHVLSDAASCLRYLDEFGEGPLELALDPASMLEPSMLADAEDHLERALSALAGRSVMVLVHDVRPRGADLAAVPLGEGVLPRDAVWRLLAAHVPPQTPVVLLE